MRIATHLDDLQMQMPLPGITVKTTPADRSVISRFQIQRFEIGGQAAVCKIIC